MQVKVLKRRIKGGKTVKLKIKIDEGYPIPTPHGWMPSEPRTVVLSASRPFVAVGSSNDAARLFNGATETLNLFEMIVLGELPQEWKGKKA